ncbi:hypothetical protein [Chromobacterium amazonense]|uniref:hypothetical protein n=1 Tax=Chromobacterium amazonense TaxID=1382803 RepID=UPI003F7B28AC
MQVADCGIVVSPGYSLLYLPREAAISNFQLDLGASDKSSVDRLERVDIGMHYNHGQFIRVIFIFDSLAGDNLIERIRAGQAVDLYLNGRNNFNKHPRVSFRIDFLAGSSAILDTFHTETTCATPPLRAKFNDEVLYWT